MPVLCRYRGPLLLHAAQSWDADAFEVFAALGYHDVPRDKDAHPAGGIVGRCNVIGCIEPMRVDTRARIVGIEAGATAVFDPRWHFPRSFALVLTDVEPLPFVPCRGALGLWTPPTNVLQALGLSEASLLAVEFEG